MRSLIAAAVITGSLALTSGATAAPPLRDRFPVAGEFNLDTITASCGFPVTVSITGTFSIAVFQDRNGQVTREIDTQPGAILTYSSKGGSVSYPFSGVLHTSYPQGAVVGAPAELVVTGNTGPFSDTVPLGSGRVVLDGFVAAVEDGFPLTRFTGVESATGNFSGQIARICSVLAP